MKVINAIIVTRNAKGNYKHFYAGHFFCSDEQIEVYEKTEDDVNAIKNVIHDIYTPDEFLEQLDHEKVKHLVYFFRLNGKVYGQKIERSDYYFK